MHLSDCDALIFDSDGVLVDSEGIHIAVETELLAEIGLNYDRATYLSRFVGLSNPDYFAALQSDYAVQVGGAFPLDFGERLQARIWPRIDSELQPIAGVEALVRAFRGVVAVGSSAPIERLNRKLTITNLISLFDPHIYSADHVRSGKPSPDLFLHAAHLLGVHPQKCAVIEDSVNGIRAATAAQMLPIGFVGGSHADAGLRNRLKENGARFVVSQHREIIEMLTRR